MTRPSFVLSHHESGSVIYVPPTVGVERHPLTACAAEDYAPLKDNGMKLGKWAAENGPDDLFISERASLGQVPGDGLAFTLQTQLPCGVFPEQIPLADIPSHHLNRTMPCLFHDRSFRRPGNGRGRGMSGS